MRWLRWALYECSYAHVPLVLAIAAVSCAITVCEIYAQARETWEEWRACRRGER